MSKAKKNKIKPHIQNVINQIDQQINFHTRQIELLEISKELWIQEQPPVVTTLKDDVPLTRALVRTFLESYGEEVQTVKIIDLLYGDKKTQEEKNKLVKNLSVILNQMEKGGEINVIRKPKVKGNFYGWNYSQ